jgi:hypothetical protein
MLKKIMSFFGYKEVEKIVKIGDANVEPLESGWIQTSLFVGLNKPNGGVISQQEFNAFICEHLTPSFPDGSTILNGSGQWLDAAKQITIAEESRTIIVSYPSAVFNAKNKAIKKISQEYCNRFGQDAVMRVDQKIEVVFYSQTEAQPQAQ